MLKGFIERLLGRERRVESRACVDDNTLHIPELNGRYSIRVDDVLAIYYQPLWIELYYDYTPFVLLFSKHGRVTCETLYRTKRWAIEREMERALGYYPTFLPSGKFVNIGRVY